MIHFLKLDSVLCDVFLWLTFSMSFTENNLRYKKMGVVRVSSMLWFEIISR